MSVYVSAEDGLGRLILNQPPLNLLTREVLAAVRRELDRLAALADLRALLLAAEGPHFSAGADVGEHLPPECDLLIPEFLDTMADVACFPVPVVAAVRGRCLGGGFELAMAADLIVAGESATFGQPEIVLGVLPPAACVLLPRLVGPGRAAEIVLGGDALSAAEAAAAGLVHAVVTDDEVEAAAAGLAERFTRHSAAALRIGKRMLLGRPADLRSELARAGKQYIDELMKAEDAVEGLQAFLEKRQPRWSHR